MSSDGGLLDVHVTAFISSTDNLLTAGRSNSPSKVLPPMKAVVNAVTAILDDATSYECRRELTVTEEGNMRLLRERIEATLSNLVAAAKTHAISMGMSPVSLLDAASSHLSAAVTELGRTTFIRKATKGEQDQFLAASGSMSPVLNGFVPTIRSIDEVKLSVGHRRAGSTTSFRTNDSPSSIPSKLTDNPFSPISHLQAGLIDTRSTSPLSSTGSPPPLFEQSNRKGASDDPTVAEGTDDAWAELKVWIHMHLACSLLTQFTSLAISGSPVGSNCLRDTECVVRRSQCNPITISKRRLNANHHNRLKYRRRL